MSRTKASLAIKTFRTSIGEGSSLSKIWSVDGLVQEGAHSDPRRVTLTSVVRDKDIISKDVLRVTLLSNHLLGLLATPE